MVVHNVGGMTSSEVLLQDLIDLEAKEVIAGLVEPAVSTVRIDTTRLESLTDNGIVRVLKTAAAEIARLEAIQVRGTAVLARRRSDRTDTAAEIALALCLTDNYAGDFVAASEALISRLPNTFALLERGQLNLLRAMKVTEATAWLSDEAAREA
ncbi:MAG TPA: HNH endonuclease, partial [Amycolatopsis sp.]|nr:HNH endonuclease [Amycolatopsis sp.]